MIDRVQRGYAEQVASGCPVSNLPEPIPFKTEVYGLLAAAFAKIKLEKIETDLAGYRGKTSRGLMRILSNSLFEQVFAIRRVSEPARLDALFNERRIRDDELVAPHLSLGRVTDGVNAAVYGEALAIDTMVLRTAEGLPLTRRGAIASQRVPFTLARLSLEGLNPTLRGVTQQAVSAEALGIGPEVLTADACVMHPGMGLALSSEYLQDPPQEYPDEPHLGCPITMVPGFMRGYHTIVAQAALQREFIRTID